MIKIIFIVALFGRLYKLIKMTSDLYYLFNCMFAVKIFFSRNEKWGEKLPGRLSPRLPGYGHQHWHSDTQTLWTSPLPKCLGPANLWQVLWAARREVCFMRKWSTFGFACFRELESICTVGFEPNIMHNNVLLELEEQYQGCGWQVSLGLVWHLFVYLLLVSQ